MIYEKTIATIFAITLLLAGCTSPQPVQTTPPFPEWEINLDQPIGQLEKTLSTLEQQQSMNYTISNLAFLYDAKLRILFDDFLVSLPESARTSQIDEQRTWLNQRKVQILQAYSKYGGGTMASYNAAQVSIDITKERIITIQERMKGK